MDFNSYLYWSYCFQKNLWTSIMIEVTLQVVLIKTAKLLSQFYLSVWSIVHFLLYFDFCHDWSPDSWNCLKSNSKFITWSREFIFIIFLMQSQFSVKWPKFEEQILLITGTDDNVFQCKYHPIFVYSSKVRYLIVSIKFGLGLKRKWDPCIRVPQPNFMPYFLKSNLRPHMHIHVGRLGWGKFHLPAVVG